MAQAERINTFQAQKKREAFLDPSVDAPDLLVQGLNTPDNGTIQQMRVAKVARIHLLIIRESIILTCKDTIPLESGSTISKKKLIEISDNEIRSLK